MFIPTVTLADIDLGTRETPFVYDPENERLNQLKRESVDSVASTFSTNSTIFVDVDVSRQIVGYYCGPASAYMLLKGLGVTVPSSTKTLPFFNGCPSNCPYPTVTHVCQQSYTSPQITLANSMGMGYDCDFIMLRNAINSRLPNNYYSYQYASTETAVRNAIVVSINSNHPSLGWVYANKLSWYSGSSFGGHYVVFYSYVSTSDKAGIADPNYNTQYGGKHLESISSLTNAMYRANSAANILW